MAIIATAQASDSGWTRIRRRPESASAVRHQLTDEVSGPLARMACNQARPHIEAPVGADEPRLAAAPDHHRQRHEPEGPASAGPICDQDRWLAL
ncbi:hypothetical protein [Streptomyces sp. NPDC056683]|uniref:hypothetical protein n=1 Tax=Streptomyces sp. NPDC056683 TaxID=3345910 RepID=UPI0036886087